MLIVFLKSRKHQPTLPLYSFTTTLPSSSTMPSIAATRRQLNHLHESHNKNHTASSHDSRVLHWHYGEYDSDDRNFQIHGETLLYIFILFSLILLATLLLLYARWFFRLRHLPSSFPSSVNPPNPQFIVSIPRPAPILTCRGLNQATIDSIPIILHQSPDVIDGKANRDLECCICLGVFEYGDKVKVLPSCGHRYHCDCVDAWLCEHSNCPLCRLPIPFDLRL